MLGVEVEDDADEWRGTAVVGWDEVTPNVEAW